MTVVKDIDYNDNIMVKEILKENKTIYLCEACGLGYKDSQTAGECVHHCNTYHSCSLKITSQAILK